MQALYQWQVNPSSARDLVLDFMADEEHARVDQEFFRELLTGVIDRVEELDAEIGALSDRRVEHLDPVEHSILLIGMYELMCRAEVPYRVVINEAVSLCRTYGAEDGHKFVNALLDRAARHHRSAEIGSRTEKPCP
jgi:N utilization substance protein B